MRRRRGQWRGLVLLAAAAAALVVAPCDRAAEERDGDDGAAALTGLVVEVTDGDTVVVELADGSRERVRYIGIDTPESTPDQPLECFGDEAAEANSRLVEDRQVQLRLGPERRDDYGRLLAFVRVDGLLVNAELIRGGFARVLTIAPNDQLASRFELLEAAAGRAGRGLWGACNT